MPTYDITDSTINSLFLRALKSPEDRVKLAEATELYIRDKVRESAFSRKILPPMPITKEECDRSEHHPTLTKVIDLEVGATAVSLTMRGTANSNYITAPRFAIYFHKIATEEHEISEGDLLAYEMPVTQIIEKNCVKAIEKVEDETFIAQCEDIVTTTGKTLNITSADPILTGRDLTTLFNLLEQGDELETSILLMGRSTWNAFSGQGPAAFDAKAYDVLVNGFKEETILNKRVIVTNKEDLVPYNTVWAFTAPEFMGRFYALDDVKFWVDSKAEFFRFKAWEYIGMGVGNIKSMAKITISATP